MNVTNHVGEQERMVFCIYHIWFYCALFNTIEHVYRLLAVHCQETWYFQRVPSDRNSQCVPVNSLLRIQAIRLCLLTHFRPGRKIILYFQLVNSTSFPKAYWGHYSKYDIEIGFWSVINQAQNIILYHCCSGKTGLIQSSIPNQKKAKLVSMVAYVNWHNRTVYLNIQSTLLANNNVLATSC